MKITHYRFVKPVILLHTLWALGLSDIFLTNKHLQLKQNSILESSISTCVNTHMHNDRQTLTRKDRHTDRPPYTYILIDKHTYTHKDRQTYIETYTQTYIQRHNYLQ